MLTLSLLLGAAVGVNAIIGGEIDAIKISETQFICSEDCVHQAVYFSSGGYACPSKEILVRVDGKGNDLPEPFSGSIFDCEGKKAPAGGSLRPLASGDELFDCDLYKITDPDRIACNSFKSPGSGSKTVEWSDIAKELESAGAPQQNTPAPQKSQQDCAREGGEAFRTCRAKPSANDFAQCDKEGREAIEKCMRGE